MVKFFKIVVACLLLSLPVAGFAETRLVTIGIIAPLSGPFAAIGKEVVDGATLALQEQATGDTTITPKIIIEDDRYEPIAGVTAFKKLASIDKISALLNLSSPTIGAIYPLLKHTTMPVIQFGEQTEEPLADTVFQMSPGSMEGFRQFGARTKARRDGTAVILVGEDATLLRFVDAFKQGFGGSVETMEVPAGTKDLQTFVLKALSKNPAWIVPFLMPDQATLVVNSIIGHTQRPALALPLFQVSFEDYKRLVPHIEKLRDDFTCAFPDPEQGFKKRFQAKFGFTPGSWGGFGYDGMVVLLKTYRVKPDAWLAAIASYQGQGVSGPIAFDAVGVRTPIFDTLSVGEYLDRVGRADAM